MYHFYNQITEHGTFSIFGGYNEIGSGEHSRDFIHVNDTVQAKLWFLNNPKINGIYNIGTGISNTYNKLGECIINWFEANSKIKPQKNYIDFPKNLQGSYQDYTKADLSSLREVGFRHQFLDLQSGINLYLDYLNSLNA